MVIASPRTSAWRPRAGRRVGRWLLAPATDRPQATVRRAPTSLVRRSITATGRIRIILFRTTGDGGATGAGVGVGDGRRFDMSAQRLMPTRLSNCDGGPACSLPDAKYRPAC